MNGTDLKHQKWIAMADENCEGSELKAKPPTLTTVVELANALRAATRLAMAEREYRFAIVALASLRPLLSSESFDETPDARARLERAKVRLRQAGGEP
jgi:hypothetical protein